MRTVPPPGRQSSWIPGRPDEGSSLVQPLAGPHCGNPSCLPTLWRPHSPRALRPGPCHLGQGPLLGPAKPWAQRHPQAALGTENTLGPARPLPTRQKVSLPALEDVLGMELTGDKGCPSGLLTPSLCSIPGGGVPTAVCSAQAKVSSHQEVAYVNPRWVPIEGGLWNTGTSASALPPSLPCAPTCPAPQYCPAPQPALLPSPALRPTCTPWVIIHWRSPPRGAGQAGSAAPP